MLVIDPDAHEAIHAARKLSLKLGVLHNFEGKLWQLDVQGAATGWRDAHRVTLFRNPLVPFSFNFRVERRETPKCPYEPAYVGELYFSTDEDGIVGSWCIRT